MNLRLHLPIDLPAFIILVALVQAGCDRRDSGASGQPPKASVAPKTQLVPLTNMVLIKAGSFVRQKFPVTITRDFWLGKYEVTQREYMEVMGRSPSHFPGDANRPVEKV